MKRANFLNILVAGLLLAVTATGCKRNPKNITVIPGQSRPELSANDPSRMERPVRPVDLGAGSTGIPVQQPNLTSSEIPEPMQGASEDRAALAPQTIYFDFDRSAIKPSEQGKLNEVATYLKNNPAVQLRVEGHCDERGTEEYNRALGERRAIAAREFLIQKHGIESGRVTTVSYGEDKPVDPAKTEEAYARNRRAEFVVLSAR